MKGGDLSNDVPPRVVVTLDVVSRIDVTKGRRPFSKIRERIAWDPHLLSELHDWSFSRGVSLELAVIGRPEDPADIERSLDNWGTNPFRYVLGYRTVEELVDSLPFRKDLYGVVDIPGRALRYGGWAVGLEELP